MTVRERPSPAPFLTPLIIRAQDGDHKAFDALCREHRPVVHAWCVRLMRSESEGEQAAQDVFVRVLAALPGFQGLCPLRNWLLRVASNVCLNLLRTKKGAGVLHSLSLDGVSSGDSLLAGPGIEEGVIRNVYAGQLRSLIRDCAKTAARPWDALDADIFHLLYECGVETAREVAERLDRSEDTVKYRTHHRIAPVLAAVRLRLQAEEDAV